MFKRYFILIFMALGISRDIFSMHRPIANMATAKRPFSTNKRTLIMPSKFTLRDRLWGMDLAYYAEKTDIAEKLANKKLVPLGVSVIVTCSMYDYMEYTKKHVGFAADLRYLKPEILRTILQDSRWAAVELENYGLIKKNQLMVIKKDLPK